MSDSSLTLVGESVQVRGSLTGDEDLHVLGRVEGSIELQRTLVVAESGIVKAEVHVRNAVVSGIVVGNIQATESVELTREGRMVGDISAPRVIIVDGASFRGNVDMGDAANMPVRRPPAERSRPAPTPRPEPARAAPARPLSSQDKAPDVQQEGGAHKELAPPAEADDKTESAAPPAPAQKDKPRFLEPPKAKGLPKKSKSRVVVKRR